MTVTEAELVRWGEQIGRRIELPVFIGLVGPLGAGKSVLARAIAAGAGVSESMPSPTFNLLFRYASARGGDVVHLDLYRLKDAEEVWELGWQELGAEGDMVLVEWPARAGPHLPEDRWEVALKMSSASSTLREVVARRVGSPPALPVVPFAPRPERGDGPFVYREEPGGP